MSEKSLSLGDILKRILIYFAVAVIYVLLILLFFDWLFGPKAFLHEKIFTEHSIQDCEKNILYTDYSYEKGKEINDILERGFGHRVLFYDDISPKYIIDIRNQGSIEIVKYYRFAVNEKYIVYYSLNYDKTTISKGKVYHFNNESYYELIECLKNIN